MIDKQDPGVSPAVWQEQNGWHVRIREAGDVRVFATRDEAISFSTSTFTDGLTAARADAQRGDVAQVSVQTVENTTPRPAQKSNGPPESGNECCP